MPIIVSVGGSDSSAGAGIQGDLKTAVSMGAWCHTVVTAVTAQIPQKVTKVISLAPDEVMAQLEVLFSLDTRFSPQVLKTGMLGNADLIPVLGDFIESLGKPVVLDTVLQATSGASLAERDVPVLMKDHLLSKAALITPNLPEAALLLNSKPAETVAEMHQQGKALLELGAQAVLLKGGHLPGDLICDLLLTRTEAREFFSEKIPTTHTHGSGCALATAVAVGLAQGRDLFAAVEQARAKIRQFILKASECHFVENNGPLVHFNLQEKERYHEA